MVFSLFTIDNSRVASLRSKQSIQLSQLGHNSSIAPDNLPLAAEIFRLRLQSQDADFAVERMTSLPAWSTFQSTLSAYAERLKLLNTQSEEIDRHLQERSSWTTNAALASFIAFLFLSQISRLTK
jgi:hypothetical protein